MSKINKLNNLWFIVGLVIGLTLLWPIFHFGLFSHHEQKQILGIIEMDNCLKDWQIPCRWTPNLSGKYGTATFNYLAPLPYYAGDFFYRLTGNLLLAYKLVFIIPVLGSFLFMYLFGRRLWGSMGGSLSAIFYLLAPYHAVSLYVRGDLGELWSLMLFPALLWSIVKLWQQVRVIDVLSVGLFIATLILSDALFALLFLPIALIFLLVLYLQKKERRHLRFMVIAVGFGFLLSCFYLIPAIFERNLIHDPTIYWSYSAYTEHFKGLYKLLIEHSWGWGQSVREVPGGLPDTMSYQIGWLHLLVWLGAVVGMKIVGGKKFTLVLFSSSAALFSIFMVHPKSQVIWDLFAPLKYFHYPWQFLSIIIFFICLPVGSIMLSLPKQYRVWVWGLLVVGVLILNIGYFRPERFLSTNNLLVRDSQYFNDLIKQTNFDYLPKNAEFPPKELPTKLYEKIAGNGQISSLTTGSNWIAFDITGSTLTNMKLSQHYFPDWKAFVDGKEIQINPHNDLGLLNIAIDPGSHHVELKLYETGVRAVSNVLSSIGLLIFILLVMSQYRKTRSWLNYYIRSLNK